MNEVIYFRTQYQHESCYISNEKTNNRHIMQEYTFKSAQIEQSTFIVITYRLQIIQTSV